MTKTFVCDFLPPLRAAELLQLLEQVDMTTPISAKKEAKNQAKKTIGIEANTSMPVSMSMPLSACWLANAAQPVIGVLPKVSWTGYPNQTANCSKNSLLVRRQQRQQSFVTNELSYDDLAQQLIDYCNCQATPPLPDNQKSQTQYQHGLMGFVSYDAAAQHMAADIRVHTEQPCVYFGHYDMAFVPVTPDMPDRAEGRANSDTSQQPVVTDYCRWQLCVYASDQPPDMTLVTQLLSQLQQLWQQSSQSHAQNSICGNSQHNSQHRRKNTCQYDAIQSTAATVPLTPRWQYTDYAHAFATTQSYLQAGDCYQINLTQCWQGQLDNQPLLAHLPRLIQQTQAPYAGYLKLDDLELISCSPELFFQFVHTDDGQMGIITKPIKGTRPRGRDEQHDQQLLNELATSSKDLAENVMIVDLLRNDLGRFAQTGTVKVPQRFAIESFANVHHMVSTITATLKKDTHPLAVLFASLPAGSITGTPKRRAIELINELEGQPRGAYCGSMGFINFDGTGQFNVLIRTLQASNGKVELWAGGGITVASQCDDEYQECWDKVGNVLTMLAGDGDNW